MSKQWGNSEYWGLGSDYDPDWVLTEKQKKIRNELIDLCRRKIRPQVAECDKNYEFPRESLNALSELGLLGLLVPKELGGLGENHVCAAMVIETLGRYGCPSTAMVYTMHILACTVVLLRYHDNSHIRDLLSRLDKDKMVGTVSFSDPATGSHFWFHISSKAKYLNENLIRVLKYGSWSTSAGCADWYTIQTVSPGFDGDYSDLSSFLVYKDEVRASSDDWSALGMHGNMSGPIIIEGKFGPDRLIGPVGDGKLANDEMEPMFLMCAASCWNGISLGCMDIAKKHVTRKTHADVGMRVCDYPTIQDYFGECIIETNAARCFVFMNGQVMDNMTNNCDWLLHSDHQFLPRSKQLHWLWQARFKAAKNVTHVSDNMLQACGGSGYKTDMGLERLLRDAKAAWLMGPTNEVLRQLVGKTVLNGLDGVDFWEQVPNERVVHHEIKKMSADKKEELAKLLLEEVESSRKGAVKKHSFQDTDFDNPFNTSPPTLNDKMIETGDGVIHSPALSPEKFTALHLQSRREVSDKMASFIFDLPDKHNHTGCFPGQYVTVKVNIKGKEHIRYFSPVSPPDEFGRMELVLKFETYGLLSQYFKNLKPGDKVEFQGPSGGFEYESGKLDVLTILASGGGITPGMQLIRCILKNPKDTTKIKLLYFCENFSEILYREELDNYAAKDARLLLVYSLGETPEDWEGEEGFIDTHMINKHVNKPNSIRHKILMCGGPTMVVSCLHSLRVLGYPSHTVFIYGQFGTEQVKMVYGRNVQLSGHTCDNSL